MNKCESSEWVCAWCTQGGVLPEWCTQGGGNKLGEGGARLCRAL